MFHFQDGSEVRVGDSVLLETGRTPGVVELIVRTREEMDAINVDEAGIMLTSPPFGRIYIPQWSLEQDPLLFVSRAAQV